MKRFLEHKSNRLGHDGWAIMERESNIVLPWSACTTREEARQLKRDFFKQKDAFNKYTVVKVKIKVSRA